MTKLIIKNLILTIVLALIYFVSAKLGLSLAFVNESSTVIWPTGIAIASLLIFGYKVWPGIFLGAFFANVTTAGTILTSLGIATGNTLEGLVGTYLVNRYANGRSAFEHPADIFKFACLAGILATAISATIGVTSLALGGFANWNDFFAIWFTWLIGDMGGALVIAPFLILWASRRSLEWNNKKYLEALLLFGAVLFTGLVIFSPLFGKGINLPIEFISFPVLIWAAFRFGRRITVTVTTILSIIAIQGTLKGFGPFVRLEINESLLLLLLFMAVSNITALSVAALVAQGKQFATELAKSNRQIKELDKLKGEFLSMASHELRTPMAAVKGLIAMILAGYYGSLTDELKKPLLSISISTDRLIKLINDLLDISRIETGRLKINLTNAPIGELAEEVITRLQPLAEHKGIKLEFKKLGSEMVRADPDKVKQILDNLIGNAIKFTPKGVINISSKAEDGKVLVDITDTGIGIEDLDKIKVFQKYQQVNYGKVRPQGTGLGLFISKELAKRMGGDVWLKKTAAGKGSTFTFSLPKSEVG